MGLFEISLILATVLCSLVAGFLFAFAVVVMPGIKRLNDREFIHSFQVIDGIIQDNQLVFVLVWVGSIVALIISVALGIWQLGGFDLLLLIAATLIYLLGVQLPTMMVNLPLNNMIQTLDVDSMDERVLSSARMEFEPRWNRWNYIRTVLSCLSSLLLVILLFII